VIYLSNSYQIHELICQQQSLTFKLLKKMI